MIFKLSDKDLEKIREIIRGELQEALTAFLVRTVTVVESGRGKDGKPEKVAKEVVVNVLDWYVKYAPLIEGAIRGCQQDSNKTVNRTVECIKQIDYLTRNVEVQNDILYGAEKAMKNLVSYTSWVEEKRIELLDKPGSIIHTQIEVSDKNEVKPK